MLRPVLVLALAAVTLPAGAAADEGFRCTGGLISVGDCKIDLLGKCGLPSLEEATEDQRTTLVRDRHGQGAVGRTLIVPVERWTYNFGPQRLLEIVTLEAGRIVHIRQGGYGYPVAVARREGALLRRAGCDASLLAEGLTTFDVLARCGEPTLREVRQEARLVAAGIGELEEQLERTRVREVWTYDFGPRALVRFVDLEDGVVRAIRIGAYGYSRDQ